MGNEQATREKNFVAELVSGDFGLVNTYWWFGVLGGGVLSIPIAIFNEALGRPRIAAILFLILLIYFIPVLIGIWNAAGKYKGRKAWAILAKLAVVLGVLKIMGGLVAASTILI